MLKCPNCGRENAANFNFCLDCGYDLKAYRESMPATEAAPAPLPRAPTSTPMSVAAPAPPPPAPPLPVRAPTSAGLSPPLTPAEPPLVPAPAPGFGSGPKCGACGALNAPGVRFCGSCGSRIDGNAGSAQEAGRTMFMHAHVEAPQKIVKLVTIDQTGREGMTFTLRAGETVCGRVNGMVLFDDPFVSPTHCRFIFQNGKLRVIDAPSLNGIYLRVKAETPLNSGDLLRIGRQLFRFEHIDHAAVQVKRAEGDDSKVWGSPHPGAYARLMQILDDGRTGEIRLLSSERVQIGRETGDIVIPTDGFVSGRHCVFVHNGKDVTVQDLGSSNGTYLRVKNEADVVHGDFLLVGNQMLRIEII